MTLVVAAIVAIAAIASAFPKTISLETEYFQSWRISTPICGASLDKRGSMAVTLFSCKDSTTWTIDLGELSLPGSAIEVCLLSPETIIVSLSQTDNAPTFAVLTFGPELTLDIETFEVLPSVITKELLTAYHNTFDDMAALSLNLGAANHVSWAIPAWNIISYMLLDTVQPQIFALAIKQHYAAPSGVFLNPGGTLAAVTFYESEINKVDVYRVLENGVLNFEKSILLLDKQFGIKGEQCDKAVWMSNETFYVASHGVGNENNVHIQSSFWVCKVQDRFCRVILGKRVEGEEYGRGLEGKIGAFAVAGNRLVVIESPVSSLTHDTHVSLWALRTKPTKQAKLISRTTIEHITTNPDSPLQACISSSKGIALLSSGWIGILDLKTFDLAFLQRGNLIDNSFGVSCEVSNGGRLPHNIKPFYHIAKGITERMSPPEPDPTEDSEAVCYSKENSVIFKIPPKLCFMMGYHLAKFNLPSAPSSVGNCICSTTDKKPQLLRFDLKRAECAQMVCVRVHNGDNTHFLSECTFDFEPVSSASTFFDDNGRSLHAIMSGSLYMCPPLEFPDPK